jgi:hypothetical protein
MQLINILVFGDTHRAYIDIESGTIVSSFILIAYSRVIDLSYTPLPFWYSVSFVSANMIYFKDYAASVCFCEISSHMRS